VTSAVILALSFAGRWYAPKIGVTKYPFTVSILSNILGSYSFINFMYFSGSLFLLFEHSFERKEVPIHFTC
jgi:hypothetical protein